MPVRILEITSKKRWFRSAEIKEDKKNPRGTNVFPTGFFARKSVLTKKKIGSKLIFLFDIGTILRFFKFLACFFLFPCLFLDFQVCFLFSFFAFSYRKREYVVKFICRLSSGKTGLWQEF